MEDEAAQWIATSRRAAEAKPWDILPLDQGHFVRKTKLGVKNAKSRIDNSEPHSRDRWRGRNFDTVSRKAEEKTQLADTDKRRLNVKARVESYSAPHEQKKNVFNAKAHPPLQRRTKDRSFSEIEEWRPNASAVALTVKESFDAKIWSINPKRVSVVAFVCVCVCVRVCACMRADMAYPHASHASVKA
jgi:hypothetical protein